MVNATSEACIAFEAMTPHEQKASGLSDELFRQVYTGETSSGSEFVDFAVRRAESYDPELVAEFRRIEQSLARSVGHPVMLVTTECLQTEQKHAEDDELSVTWSTDTTLKTYGLGILNDSQPRILDNRTWALPTESYAYVDKVLGKPVPEINPTNDIHIVPKDMTVNDYREGYTSHAASGSSLVHEQRTKPTDIGGERRRHATRMELYIGNGAIARAGKTLAAQQHRLLGALVA